MNAQNFAPYVIAHIAELTGPEKTVSLGEVEDKVTLEALMEQCLKHVDKHLEERDRDVTRHFWHNDSFVPFGRAYRDDSKMPVGGAYLRDVANGVNVILEVRPDYYQVTLPRKPANRYAIDPELTAAQAVDALMGKGMSRCYALQARDGQPLQEEKTLLAQDTLPYHARLMQQETRLAVRRKPLVLAWWLLLLSAFVAAGLLLAYLFASRAG